MLAPGTVSGALDTFIKEIRPPEIEFQFRYVIEHETARRLKNGSG